MSLFSSSSKTTSTGSTSPTNPKPVTDSLIDFTRLINSLGGQDPRKYVTGPSNLQNAAFSMGAGIANRYGAQPSFGMGVPQGQGGQSFDAYGKAMVNGGPRTGSPDTGVPGQTVGKKQYTSEMPRSVSEGGGQTLYGNLGVTPTPDANIGQLTAQNYTADPELEAGWQRVASRPKDQDFIKRSGGDYDNNGSISREEFMNWHRGTFNDRQSYQPEVLNTQLPVGGQPAAGGGGGQGGGQQAPGYSAATGGINPLDMYRNAADMTMNAGNSGPNLAGMAGLGPANVYNASGQAQTQGYQASGPAGAGGYDAALIDRAAQIGELSSGSAAQGYAFSKPYENQYTDSVVNTSLAGFDEYAGRQRAAEAAQAAGNNAFGGSRFGVQRAITEEQIARERAATESGLRFNAQDKAFGYGMQDASTASQVSLANAAAANARAEAQAQLEQQQLLANQASQNQARMFGADAFNRSGLDFAGRSDQAGAFGADAFNRSSLDFAGRTDQSGQFNAGSQNQFDLTQFGAANDMSRFNAGQAETAQNRRLMAGGQLGGLANDAAGNERADLAMLAQLGEQERGINQQQSTADLQLMQLMAQLYGTVPYGLFNGQNTTGTTRGTETPSGIDSFNSVLDAGSKVAAIFSDARLKEDIAPIGTRAGHNWYRFRYTWDAPGRVREGVMAQEVRETRPDAVIDNNGLLMVDYDRLFGADA